MPPAEVLEAVLDRSGYLKELSESTDPQDESRIENLSELVGVAREFEERVPDGGLPEFLEQVSLVADADSVPDPDGNGGVVTLMTLLPRVVELLRERGADDVVVFGGGIIPEDDIAPLEAAGVTKIFTAGASPTAIVEWVRANVGTPAEA